MNHVIKMLRRLLTSPREIATVIDYDVSHYDRWGPVSHRIIYTIPHNEAIHIKRAVALSDGTLKVEAYDKEALSGAAPYPTYI